MILNLRGFVLALSSVVVLGVTGCSEDNEATVRAGANASTGTATTKPSPPTKDQREYFDQRQQAGTGTTKANGYPGAK